MNTVTVVVLELMLRPRYRSCHHRRPLREPELATPAVLASPAPSKVAGGAIATTKPNALYHPPSSILISTMTSVAAGLFNSLPKPKYTGEDEELPAHAQPRGPRVVGAGQLDETQIVVKVSRATSGHIHIFY